MNELFKKSSNLILQVHALETKLGLDYIENEVTSLQMNLLKILYFSSPKNLSSLSKCLNINLPNCSREVKKLTSLGFINKCCSFSDKRKTEISLSISGKEKIENLLYYMETKFKQGKENWSDNKIKRCIDAINILTNELLI